MTLRAVLEDFAAPSAGIAPGAPGAPDRVSEAEAESQRLESFDTGYRAGWDDAIKAQSDDHNRVSSAFAQNLQDLSFTYHEAYSQVMRAMTPLLEEMVGVLLPGLAKDALGQQIVTQLSDISREVGSLDVVIAVSPGNLAAVEPLLEAEYTFPLRLEQDTTLSEDQADIRFGDTERQIDLGAVLHSVTEAVRGFAYDSQKAIANG